MPTGNSSKVNIVQLANCEVLDKSGTGHKMGSLWKNQTALFVYLRHFACITCRAHATQVWNEREKFEVKNTKLYFIGNGKAQYIEGFQNELKLEEASIFTDPSLLSFQAAGFHRGFFRTNSIASYRDVKKYKSMGYTNGNYEKGVGDIWQLGGLIAVKSTGQVVYHFISESVGDFPAEEEVRATPWISKN